MKKTFLTISFLYGIILISGMPGFAHAEFTFNFQPHGGPDAEPPFNCNRGADPVPCDTSALGDFEGLYVVDEPTPFLMEVVEVDGQNYVHYVVGDPDDGFAMEVYIRGTYSAFVSPDTSIFAAPYGIAQNGPLGGAGQGPLTERVPVIDPETGEELTDPATGRVITTDLINGRGNPTKMAVRQVMGDAGSWDGTSLDCSTSEFCSDFIKDSELTKPSIKQVVNSGSVTADFEMDMRAITYDDINTAAPIVNTVTFSEDIPGGFDMAADIQLSTVTGGRFTYTPGDVREGSLGDYEYWDGGFNMENIKWETYRDPSINPEINLEPYPNEF